MINRIGIRYKLPRLSGKHIIREILIRNRVQRYLLFVEVTMDISRINSGALSQLNQCARELSTIVWNNRFHYSWKLLNVYMVLGLRWLRVDRRYIASIAQEY
jgi:hypothetical protein